MTDRDFVYWLQGFAELNDAPPSKAQWKSIREHLSLVFEKRTPAVGVPRQAIPNILRERDQTMRTECQLPPISRFIC